MITVLANALVPVFGGLVVGYLGGLRRVMDNQNVRSLNTFVMSFAVPCALFLAIATTPLKALRLQARPALVFIVLYLILYILSFMWARSREKLNPSDSAVIALTIGLPNSAAVGLPLLTAVFGSQATVSVATALATASVTVAPLTPAILEANRSGEGLGFKRVCLSFIRSFRKPIVWAPLLGLVFSATGLLLPAFVNRSLSVLGSASDGAALVLTGLVVSAQKVEIGSDTLIAVFLKNALQPALALGIAFLIHLPLEETRHVALVAAMPCGYFGTVFGKRFGSIPKLASTGLIASYVAGVATLAGWIVIVNHLG